MPTFALREPVSALTHAVGLVAALPTTWLLIRSATRQVAIGPAGVHFRNGKVVSLAIFGFGMATCYGASAAYHALPGDQQTIELLRRLDLVGIFLLIAGTFTPSAWSLMRPKPRRAALAVVWGVSITCAGAMALGRPFPTWLATSIYMALGWGMVLCYADIRRDYSRETLRLLPVGGALYSMGAIINLIHGTGFLPGFGTHEVFHLFVLAGTAAHVAFLLRVAAPATAPSPRAKVRRAVVGPPSQSRTKARIGA